MIRQSRSMIINSTSRKQIDISSFNPEKSNAIASKKLGHINIFIHTAKIFIENSFSVIWSKYHYIIIIFLITIIFLAIKNILRRMSLKEKTNSAVSSNIEDINIIPQKVSQKIEKIVDHDIAEENPINLDEEIKKLNDNIKNSENKKESILQATIVSRMLRENNESIQERLEEENRKIAQNKAKIEEIKKRQASVASKKQQ